MGHDLDDEELKATKNKFYNLNKIEKNNEIHIPMVYTPLHLHNFINKIDIVLYNSEYINIINELHKLYNDYSSLYYKYFNDLNDNHIPHID